MEFVEFVRNLKRSLNRMKKSYSKEEVVKVKVVAPFLEKLGWKIPEYAIPEYKVKKGKEEMKLDYLLQMKKRGKIKNVATVEVKALNKLEEIPFIRIVKIAKIADVRYIIITDGDKWQLYDITRPLKEALICEWSILKEKLEEVERKAQIIAKTKHFGRPELLFTQRLTQREASK